MSELRWDALLAEAASAVQAEGDRDVLDEAAEILAAEQARCDLPARLARSHRVAVQVLGGGTVVGDVIVAGREVAVLDDGAGSEHVIRIAAIAWVQGLAPALGDVPVPAIPAITWSACLRDAAADTVDVWLLDGHVVRGRIESVGMDHVDLVLATGEVRTLSVTAISRLRRLRTDASRRTRASGSTCD